MSELAKCKLCGSEAKQVGLLIMCSGAPECALTGCYFTPDHWQKLNAPDPRIEKLKLKLDESRKECQRHQFLERRVVDGIKCETFGRIECNDCSNYDKDAVLTCAFPDPSFLITELEEAANNGIPCHMDK